MPVEDAYDNTESLYPTPFDEARIESLDIGDEMSAENGNFSVIRYKNDYSLIINNNIKKKSLWEFENYRDLIIFLKKN